MKIFKNSFFVASTLILMASLSRLIPHPYNFSPIDALALFAGATLWKRKAFAFGIPLVSLLLSDVILGFHPTMIYVYGSVALMIPLGHFFGKRPGLTPLVSMSLLSSILFFAITNFGVWMVGGLYPSTISGLGACYFAALPFFHWTLIGDLAFVAVIFGAYHSVARQFSLVSAN